MLGIPFFLSPSHLTCRPGVPLLLLPSNAVLLSLRILPLASRALMPPLLFLPISWYLFLCFFISSLLLFLTFLSWITFSSHIDVSLLCFRYLKFLKCRTQLTPTLSKVGVPSVFCLSEWSSTTEAFYLTLTFDPPYPILP